MKYTYVHIKFVWQSCHVYPVSRVALYTMSMNELHLLLFRREKQYCQL